MDFDKIFEEMLTAMKLEIGEGASKAGQYLQQIMEENKETLKRITGFYIKGEITEDEFQSLIKDNMITLENQLLNLNILKKKTIENVVNAGMSVIVTLTKLH